MKQIITTDEDIIHCYNDIMIGIVDGTLLDSETTYNLQHIVSVFFDKYFNVKELEKEYLLEKYGNDNEFSINAFKKIMNK